MESSINRRDLALTFGAIWATISLPGEAAAQPWTPTALTLAQARILDVAAELIMPATDTPGAREAGVPQFVDRAVALYCSPTDAAAIRTGLDRMEADARAEYRAGFVDLTPVQQTALLTRYDTESRTRRSQPAPAGRGETETGLTNAPTPVAPPQGPAFFPVLRDLVTVGYFTSQVGATKAVRYDPNPGAYRGCVPLSEIGRAWAT
jgi:gluconate 2-dehydrogenase gamma chain